MLVTWLAALFTASTVVWLFLCVSVANFHRSVLSEPKHLTPKKFAYMITSPSTWEDSRLQRSELRDLYWLTFKEKKSTDSPTFVIHRPETRWGSGRNHLTALAFGAVPDYEYYIYLDDDMLAAINGTDAWILFENWLLSEKPSVGFLPFSATWCPKEKGPTSRGTFMFDPNVLAIHKSAVGRVALLDTSWEHESDNYATVLLYWLVYNSYPGGSVGNNAIKFNYKLNRHQRRKKESEDFSKVNRYFLNTYLGDVIPEGVPKEWFIMDGEPLVNSMKNYRKDLDWITRSSSTDVGLTDSAICIFGRPGATDAPAALAKRVRSGWRADLFQANRYKKGDEDHLVVQWFNKNIPGWRSSTPEGDYLSGLPGFGNGTSANDLIDRHECLNQIRKAEAARGTPYKRVAIGRANLVWTDDHPDIQVTGNMCWIACEGGSGNRICDHWALCGRQGFTSLVEGPMAALPWKGFGMRVEALLAVGLKRQGVHIRRGRGPFHQSSGGLEYLPAQSFAPIIIAETNATS